jgi:hypothetical protein
MGPPSFNANFQEIIVKKEDPTTEVINWIEQELSREIEKPTNGHDLLKLRERLKAAKELGALLEELKSGKAQIVSHGAGDGNAFLGRLTGGTKND